MDRFLVRKRPREETDGQSQPPSVIVSWNCNSLRLRAERKELDSAVKEFLTKGMDALFLQETRIKPEDKGICESALRAAGLRDHNFYWGMHPGGKRYSGTAVIISRKCTPLSVRYSMSDLVPVGMTYDGQDQPGWEHPEKEGRLVILEYEACWVINVYTPNCSWFAPGRARREGWDARFAAAIQVLHKGRPACGSAGSGQLHAAGAAAVSRSNSSGLNESNQQARRSMMGIKGRPVIIVGDLNVCHTPLDVSHPQFFEKAKKPMNIGVADPGLQGQPGYTQEERDRFEQLLLEGCCMVDTFRALRPNERRLTWGWAANFEVGRYNGKYMGLDYFLVSQQLWDAHIVTESCIFGQNEQSCYGSDHVAVLAKFDWSRAASIPSNPLTSESSTPLAEVEESKVTTALLSASTLVATTETVQETVIISTSQATKVDAK